MTDPVLKAALGGNLERYMQDELRYASRAVTAGVKETSTEAKEALRRDVMSAGLGRRLAKTWRSEQYPKRGDSLRHAAVLYTKAPHLIEAFDKGVTIRSQDGFFLAIRSEHVPDTRYRGKRITPSNWPEHRFGPLRFVYTKTRTGLLVVDNQRHAKGKRARSKYALSKSKRARKTGYGLKTVIMFYLVPQVRLKRKLSVDEVQEREFKMLAENIDDAFRYLAKNYPEGGGR